MDCVWKALYTLPTTGILSLPVNMKIIFWHKCTYMGSDCMPIKRAYDLCI